MLPRAIDGGMTMRRMLVAAILLAGAACSDGDDSPAEADEAVTEADPAPAPEAEETAEAQAEPASTRETISGAVSGIALDMGPPIGDMTTADGRRVAFQIPAENVEAVIDAWGGVGADLTLDCEKGAPFTGEGGQAYEYYQDCRLP